METTVSRSRRSRSRITDGRSRSSRHGFQAEGECEMMLRVNIASISTGFALVIASFFIRLWYVLQRFGGFRKDVAIGKEVLFPAHPILYSIVIFLIGLYGGVRIFR